MRIAIDFDGTIVRQNRLYDDVTTPLEFVPGAREGLHALKAAGHVLLLFSARANSALRVDPNLDPLRPKPWTEKALTRWREARPLHEARYQQMIAFCQKELPGVFDAIDSGQQGKPVCELFIDDRALTAGERGHDWRSIAEMYGEK